MNRSGPVVAHAQAGPIDLRALVFVGGIIVVAAIWLVRVNRRLDDKEDPMTEVEAESDRTSPLLWVFLGVLLVGFAVAGFFMFRAQSNLASAQAQGVVDDLCRAAQQADENPTTALATFNGAPHNALHSIDTDLRKLDPVAASQLADAKQAAEAALIAGTADAADLTAELADQTAAAYRTLEPDKTVDSCT